jgi:Zn-dependent protease with chaperone function
VYAPLGVLTMVHQDLPGIIAAGKARVDSKLTMAKFIGKMAVRQVTTELDRRLDEAERARDGVEATIIADVAHLIAPTSLPAAVIDAVVHAPELVDAATLPIDGYDSLAASQVVLRLGSLTPSELAAIAAYESSHRARRTILGKIHQLQAM